jgi:hypothetical protein
MLASSGGNVPVSVLLLIANTENRLAVGGASVTGGGVLSLNTSSGLSPLCTAAG